MAKKIKLSFVFLIMLALSIACIFFPTLNGHTDGASIEGVAGNKIVLTGFAGASPEHFFLNESQNSTLVNAKVQNNGGKYYDIVGSGKGASSGWGEYCPTVDMLPFIEKGVLYAQATASITSLSGSISITLSQGEDSQQASLSKTGEIKTPMLQLKSGDNIRFSFNSSQHSFTMKEPTIHLYTIIDEVILDEPEIKTVSAGQIVDINAYNAVTQVSGTSGKFMSFSKINHEIKFNFDQASEMYLDYIEVVNSSIIIKDTAPNNMEIKFNVSCKRNSYSSEEITSKNSVTLKVDNSKVIIKLRTDFASPAKFTGLQENGFTPGRGFNLNIKENPGFTYVGVYINGELFNSSRKVPLTAISGQDIYVKFIKDITVSKIEFPGKVYDGKTDVDMSTVNVTFDGIENGHEIGLDGLSLNYTNANVGKGKSVIADFEELTLTGKNSDIYNLTSYALPSVKGDIYKREVLVTANDSEIEYGYENEEYSYSTQNLVAGESLKGNLSREPGRTIGRYKINLGNMPEQNPNYTLTLVDNGAALSIVPRTVYLDNVIVQDKTFDGDNKATITASLRNVYNNEDVSPIVSGHFVEANAGMSQEVKIDGVVLTGAQKDNYKLAEYTNQIFGNINQKTIIVKANDAEFTYGEKYQFTYQVEGLLGDDTLQGELELDSKNVGTHQIKQGSLSHQNYQITFESATCTITPRDVYVLADPAKKVYGDEDPKFEFHTQNLVEGDTFSGSLSRECSDDVGLYQNAITKGTLYNENYNIIFTSNNFEITPREITVNIEFQDKVYDGEYLTDYKVSFENNVKNENFTVNVNHNLKNKDCGTTSVNMGNVDVECTNKANYTFKFVKLNENITIKKRDMNVFVDDLSKTYGEEDKEITYKIKNLVGGESFEISLIRQEGENVGAYKYLLSPSQVQPKNYNIVLIESYFHIYPKEINVKIKNTGKIFGDNDPEDFGVTVDGEFCYGEREEDIVDGVVKRQQGENVGVYDFDFNEFSSSINYDFKTDASFIISKRPVTVKAKNTQMRPVKIYGDEDPDFKDYYTVEGEVAGEKLELSFTRDYNEDVGSYPLTVLTTSDLRYEITIDPNPVYLEIIASVISIKADTKVKIYGDEDPELTVVITDGFLKNNDQLEKISIGLLEREGDENVGTYAIKRGSFSLGNNYKITNFEEGQFVIIERDVFVKANPCQKTYGEADKELTAHVEGLAFEDKIQVTLTREEGENVGEYQIDKKEISFSDNYKIHFEGAIFKIVPKEIEIVPLTLSKEYRQAEPEIEYSAEGLKEGDVLEGGLTRNKLGVEDVGRYKIQCDLKNSNYDIVFGDYYFSILPRKITIRAQNVSIQYGFKNEPELKYDIIDGEILDGDNLTGTLYRKEGNSVGEYEIFSDLTLGRNYSIEFIKGYVTISPLDITIKIKSSSSPAKITKVYGQADPKFEYELVEGELINDDKLMGSIIREQGEEVGTYKLLCGVFNDNYNITLQEECCLEIVKKDVYLVTTALSKIYDGTTSAPVKTPYVTGLVDKDVYLDYDAKNIASFESAEIGRNIKVTIHDVKLIGEKADNYNLILPEGLSANITYRRLTQKDTILQANDAVLLNGYNLIYNLKNAEGKIDGHIIKKRLNISLEDNGENVDLNNKFDITLKVSESVYEKNNIFVYQKLANGKFKRLEVEKTDDNKLIISSAQLGQIYITIENDTWISVGGYISIGIITVFILGTIFFLLTRKKKYKNE